MGVAVILILAIAVQESACCYREGIECCETKGNFRQFCSDGLKCCKNICVSPTSSCNRNRNADRKPSGCSWGMACENPIRDPNNPLCCYYNGPSPAKGMIARLLDMQKK